MENVDEEVLKNEEFMEYRVDQQTLVLWYILLQFDKMIQIEIEIYQKTIDLICELQENFNETVWNNFDKIIKNEIKRVKSMIDQLNGIWRILNLNL